MASYFSIPKLSDILSFNGVATTQDNALLVPSAVMLVLLIAFASALWATKKPAKKKYLRAVQHLDAREEDLKDCGTVYTEDEEGHRVRRSLRVQAKHKDETKDEDSLTPVRPKTRGAGGTPKTTPKIKAEPIDDLPLGTLKTPVARKLRGTQPETPDAARELTSPSRPTRRGRALKA